LFRSRDERLFGIGDIVLVEKLLVIRVEILFSTFFLILMTITYIIEVL
jgi:hypothetical protein